MSEMKVEIISEGKKGATGVDLIFIHGISGDLRQSWTYENGEFWPDWIAEQYPQWRLLTVGHSSEIIKWFFSSTADLDLIGRSRLVLEVLKTYEIGTRPFALITHSLGGLIAKAALRKAHDNGGADESFLENARMIAFLATPHRGAGIANALSLVPGISSTIVSDIRSGNGYLDDLSDWYARAANRNNIRTLCFKESKPYRGKLIVSSDSAHAHTVDGSPIAIEQNHINVCKFEHLNVPGYRILRGNLVEAFSDTASTPTSTISVAVKKSRPDPYEYETHRDRHFTVRSPEERRPGRNGDTIDLTMEEISQIPSSDGARQIFRSLVQQAFSHHSRDTLGSGRFISIHSASKFSNGLIPEEKTSAMFHNEYMVQCAIVQSRLKGAELTFKQFGERISRPAYEMDEDSGIARNEILILEGPVGTGKTTVLSHIMYKYSDLFISQSLVPVRFDFELINSGQVIDVAHFLNDLITILGDAVLNFARSAGKDAEFQDLEGFIRSDALKRRPTDVTLNNLEEIKSALAWYIVNARKLLKLDFLLIFDNIDSQYHLYDRHLFTVEGQQIRATAIDALRTLFDSFENTRSQPLGNRGLRLLYVLRPNTRHYFVTAKIRNPFSRGAADVFMLASAPLSEIVRKRLQLLAKLCTLHKHGMKAHEYKLLENFVERLIAIEKGELHLLLGERPHSKSIADARIEMIEKISNQGLRRSVDHLSKYIWLEDDEGHDLTNRFSEQYSPQILAFILGDRCRYHQFRSNFPNMFLTRGEVVGHIREYGEYDDSVRLHPQTYWLKYLIAWYIKNEPEVRPDSVFRVFHDGGSAYPKGVVGFCMSSLVHVDSTNMVMATFKTAISSRGLTVDTLKMTQRGEVIFDKFMWSFIYLQLVVEDPNLLIPRCLKEDFAYIPGLHYGYLVANAAEYGEQTAKMVRYKASQVFLLLELLEGALQAERVRYPRMFGQLDNVGFKAPDFQKIRDDLERAVVQILGTHRKLEARADIAREVQGLRHSARTRMDSVREALEVIHTEVW